MATNPRPYTPPGIGWVFAILALLLSFLGVLHIAPMTSEIIFGDLILLALAILL